MAEYVTDYRLQQNRSPKGSTAIGKEVAPTLLESEPQKKNLIGTLGDSKDFIVYSYSSTIESLVTANVSAC